MAPLPILDGSGISFAIEGISVPKNDLFGSDLGLRDTGDVIFATPGLFVTPVEGMTLTLSFAVPIYRHVRDRPQTVEDLRVQLGVFVNF